MGPRRIQKDHVCTVDVMPVRILILMADFDRKGLFATIAASLFDSALHCRGRLIMRLVGFREKSLPRDLFGKVSSCPDTRQTSSTYRPNTSNRTHNATRNHHWPQAPRALEQHATQSARCDRVHSVVLPSQIPDV